MDASVKKMVERVIAAQGRVMQTLKGEPTEVSLTVLCGTFIMIGESIGLSKEELAKSISDGAELWEAVKDIEDGTPVQ